jgi:hypothetical protein
LGSADIALREEYARDVTAEEAHVLVLCTVLGLEDRADVSQNPKGVAMVPQAMECAGLNRPCECCPEMIRAMLGGPGVEDGLDAPEGIVELFSVEVELRAL